MGTRGHTTSASQALFWGVSYLSYHTAPNLGPSSLPSKCTRKLKFGTLNFKYIWMSFICLIFWYFYFYTWFFFFLWSLWNKKLPSRAIENWKFPSGDIQICQAQVPNDLMCLMSVLLLDQWFSGGKSSESYFCLYCPSWKAWWSFTKRAAQEYIPRNNSKPSTGISGLPLIPLLTRLWEHHNHLLPVATMPTQLKALITKPIEYWGAHTESTVERQS